MIVPGGVETARRRDAAMTCIEALKQGFGLARRGRRAVWVIFLVNLGLAALAGMPIYRGILVFTGRSLMGEQLARGFSFDWLADFAFNNPGALERYASIIAAMGLISIPVNTLLAGGVLGHLRALDSPFSVGVFFRDVTRYGWRLLRLMVLGLIGYWLVFRLANQSLGRFLDEGLFDWQDERAVLVVRLGAGLLLLVALAFVNLVMDYARVKLVMEDGTSAAGAVLGSLGFCIKRFRRAALVYAVPGLLGLALLGLYWLAVPWQLVYAESTPESFSQHREPLVVALLFILQQLVVFGRYSFRVAGWASEWSYFSASRRTAAGDEHVA